MLASLVATVYGRTYNYPFVFDDEHTITGNTTLDDPSNIPGYFTQPGMEGKKDKTGSYRPFLFSTYALNHVMSGDDPSSYHLTEQALHVINAFMVFLLIHALLRKQGVDPWPWSLIAAAVFCLHPIQTEAVIYVAARSAVLLATLFLMAVLLYIRFRNTGNTLWHALAVLSFTLGLLTKESALPLAAIFPLLEFYLRQFDRDKKPSWAYVAPFFAVAIVYIPVRLHFLGPALKGLGIDPAAHWLTEISVLPLYLKLLVWPSGLSIDHYVLKVTTLANGRLIAGLLLLTGMAALLVRYRRNRLLFALTAWPVLALLPEMLIPLDDKMVEYRLYLPMAGICILLVAMLGKRLALLDETRARAARAAAVAVLLIVSVLSFERGKVWADPETLWADAIRKSPQFSRPYNNLGYYLMQGNDYGNAEVYLAKAIELDPGYYTAYVNLGKVYGLRGEYARAEELLRKAIILNPENDMAYDNLGNVYSGFGKLGEAVSYYKKAIEINQYNYNARFNLGSALLESGRFEEAYSVFEETAKSFPEKKDVREVCAELLRRNGQPALAERLLFSLRSPG